MAVVFISHCADGKNRTFLFVVQSPLKNRAIDFLSAQLYLLAIPHLCPRYLESICCTHSLYKLLRLFQ